MPKHKPWTKIKTKSNGEATKVIITDEIRAKRREKAKKYREKLIAEGRMKKCPKKRHKRIKIDPEKLKARLKAEKLKQKLYAKKNSLEARPDFIHTCDVCGTIRKKWQQINLHMETHCEWKCEACGLKFKFKKILRQHLRAHFENFCCDFCGLICLTRVRLKNHMEKHKPDYEAKIVTKNSVYIFRHFCSFCNSLFDTPATRREHEFKFHPEKASKSEQFKCKDCEKVFFTREDRRVHSFEHFTRTIRYCDVENCGKFFKSIKLLNHHKKLHGEPTFECNFCKAKFRHKNVLNRHFKFKKCEQLKPSTIVLSPELEAMARAQYEALGVRFERPKDEIEPKVLTPKERKRMLTNERMKRYRERMRGTEREEAFLERKRQHEKARTERIRQDPEKFEKFLLKKRENQRKHIERKPEKVAKKNPKENKLKIAEIHEQFDQEIKIEIKDEPTDEIDVLAFEVKQENFEDEKLFRLNPVVKLHRLEPEEISFWLKKEFKSVYLHDCNLCGKKFASNISMDQFETTQKVRAYCQDCGKLIKSRILNGKQEAESEKIAENLSQNPKKKTLSHECDFCEMKFGLKTSLEIHIRTHLTSKTCKICGVKVVRSIWSHHKQFHMKTKKSLLEKKKKEVLKYPCTICGKLLDLSHLPEHVRCVHEKGAYKEMFKCNECECEFTRVGELKT
jgi:hypothetical protein